MKVLHINTFVLGGAANACIGLHESLLQHGIDSSLLTLHPAKNGVPYHYIYNKEAPDKKKSFYEKLLNKVNSNKYKMLSKKKQQLSQQVAEEADYFSFIDTPYDITKLTIFQQADIINLHWVADFLDWSSFFTMENHKKVVWTLHDMNPFTGGYHYAGTHQGYMRTDEEYSPAKHSKLPNIAHQQLLIKRQILPNFGGSLNIVAPSLWLKQVSEKSTLFRELPHHVIPNSVNVDKFKPLNKSNCRRVLNLPENKIILFFVSQDVAKKRKGFQILLDSLNLLKDNHNLVVCSAGAPDRVKTNGIQHIPLGNIGDARLMAVAYNAADAFMIPSLEDNLPNTVLESLACGTPVVGFSTGGIPDMVIDHFNGYLTSDKTPEGLADVIEKFTHQYTTLNKEAIRVNIEERYSPLVQATNYQKLYLKISQNDKLHR